MRLPAHEAGIGARHACNVFYAQRKTPDDSRYASDSRLTQPFLQRAVIALIFLEVIKILW